MSSPFGVIAGSGNLPYLVVQELNEKGRDVVVGFINTDVPDKLKGIVAEAQSFKPERFGEVPDFFLGNDVTELVMVGGVDRSLLYEDDRLERADTTVKASLDETEFNQDENLLESAVEILEGVGLNVRGLDTVLHSKLSPRGHQAGPSPRDEDRRTLERLGDLATILADREVGQTVLGKRQSVVAVEAAEGTNETIRRAGELAGEGLVMLKVARSNQDYRLDVPVVGASTVSELVDVEANLLAFEADKTLWVQRDDCRRMADNHNLTLLGWER